ncbi:hypothetical protein E2320_012674, partial [Naja naja]
MNPPWVRLCGKIANLNGEGNASGLICSLAAVEGLTTGPWAHVQDENEGGRKSITDTAKGKALSSE